MFFLYCFERITQFVKHTKKTHNKNNKKQQSSIIPNKIYNLSYLLPKVKNEHIILFLKQICLHPRLQKRLAWCVDTNDKRKQASSFSESQSPSPRQTMEISHSNTNTNTTTETNTNTVTIENVATNTEMPNKQMSYVFWCVCVCVCMCLCVCVKTVTRCPIMSKMQ